MNERKETEVIACDRDIYGCHRKKLLLYLYVFRDTHSYKVENGDNRYNGENWFFYPKINFTSLSVQYIILGNMWSRNSFDYTRISIWIFPV